MALQFSISVSSLLNVVWLGSIFVFFIYGQRLQMYLIANDISRALSRLKIMRDKSRKEAIDYFTSSGKVAGDPTQRIDEFLDYVTIMPVDMDPNGIVGKLQHITNSRDDRVRAEVSQIIPNSDPTKISVAENILEIATALNQIHKIVRHYYLLGKKTNSYMLLFQLQMIMPMVLQEADALVNAVDTFKLGQPVGDGIGPVIASRYMANLPKQVVGKGHHHDRGRVQGKDTIRAQGRGTDGLRG